MRKIEVEELRKIQMEILDFVDAFCRKNGIHYWITSGTLLGAVRHKGFIPWDDDMDIGMLRADYEMFIMTFNKECASSKYQFHCLENDAHWHMPFGKVIDTTTLLLQEGRRFGINVDVFPYDDVPDDWKIASKMYRVRDYLKSLNAAQRRTNPPSGSFVRKVFVRSIKFVLRLFPEFYFIRQISRKAQKYNGKNLHMVGNFTGEAKMKPCDKAYVLTTIDASFEDRTYKIPKGYDQWLRGFYGDDYMQLPPEENRKHHTFEAYVND